MFKILETEIFTEDLENIGPNSKQITKKLREFAYPQLKINPYQGSNIKKLRNIKPDRWRYRISDYRFFYEIDLAKKLIIMIAADHRKDCY